MYEKTFVTYPKKYFESLTRDDILCTFSVTHYQKIHLNMADMFENVIYNFDFDNRMS